MMRFGTGFNVHDIFFSHLHADHFLGLIGLHAHHGPAGTGGDRCACGPPEGGAGILHDAVNLGVERLPFEVVITELQSG
jgi:ribonuclease Z